MKCGCAMTLALLAACVPVVPDAAAPAPAVPPPPAAAAPQTRPIALAARVPLPATPAYLETTKFIDDGMRYADPLSQFFVSPAGEMCFRIRPTSLQVLYYDAGYRTWCAYPQAIDRVEAATDDISGIYKVRLWCAHAYPQCAHSDAGWIANNILAGTIDYLQERAAVETLIRLMGGNPILYRAAGP